MADSTSLAALNYQILQKQAAKTALESEQATLSARVDEITAEIAVLDAAIADLQAAVAGSHPVPTLTALSLTKLIVASGSQSLTVTGTGFNSGYTSIYLNGTITATTVNSATSATCTVAAGLVLATGSVTVQVRNTAPGGGSSATLTLQVVYEAPSLDSLTTTVDPLTAGSTGVFMTLTGSYFTVYSVVVLNGQIATDVTFVTDTELSVGLPDAMIATAGDIGVYVVNSTPGGGISTPLVLTVV